MTIPHDIAISKKLVPKSCKIGKKWKYSEMFVFALSMKSNVSKKSYVIFSKFPIHLYRDWTFCQIHIYTSKTLFVSHQGASWPNHMIQLLSRSVFTHQTTHLGICTWYDLDFQEKLVLFEPKKGIFWLFSPPRSPRMAKKILQWF